MKLFLKLSFSNCIAFSHFVSVPSTFSKLFTVPKVPESLQVPRNSCWSSSYLQNRKLWNKFFTFNLWNDNWKFCNSVLIQLFGQTLPVPKTSKMLKRLNLLIEFHVFECNRLSNIETRGSNFRKVRSFLNFCRLQTFPSSFKVEIVRKFKVREKYQWKCYLLALKNLMSKVPAFKLPKCI